MVMVKSGGCRDVYVEWGPPTIMRSGILIAALGCEIDGGSR